MPTAARPDSIAPTDPLFLQRGQATRNAGRGLIGLMVTLAMVGAMAGAIPLLTNGSATSSAKSSSRGLNASTASPLKSGQVAAAGNDISAAEVAACRTTYQEAQTAVDTYQVEDGALPTSISQLKALIPDPLSSSSFTITIAPGSPGQLQVATPGHPAAEGDVNCAFPGPLLQNPTPGAPQSLEVRGGQPLTE
jgi:hypothetical protein